MQIIKSTLGINTPLKGMKYFLTPPTLGVRKTLTSRHLSNRIIQRLGVIPKLGLSQFYPLNLRSRFSRNPILEGEDILPSSSAPEPVVLNLEASSIEYQHEIETGSNQTSLPAQRHTDIETDSANNFLPELPVSTPVKSSKIKQRQTKSQSKSKTKKVLPPTAGEGDIQFSAPPTAGISVNDDSKIVTTATSPTVAGFEDLNTVSDRQKSFSELPVREIDPTTQPIQTSEDQLTSPRISAASEQLAKDAVVPRANNLEQVVNTARSQTQVGDLPTQTLGLDNRAAFSNDEVVSTGDSLGETQPNSVLETLGRSLPQNHARSPNLAKEDSSTSISKQLKSRKGKSTKASSIKQSPLTPLDIPEESLTQLRSSPDESQAVMPEILPAASDQSEVTIPPTPHCDKGGEGGIDVAVSKQTDLVDDLSGEMQPDALEQTRGNSPKQTLGDRKMRQQHPSPSQLDRTTASKPSLERSPQPPTIPTQNTPAEPIDNVSTLTESPVPLIADNIKSLQMAQTSVSLTPEPKTETLASNSLEQPVVEGEATLKAQHGSSAAPDFEPNCIPNTTASDRINSPAYTLPVASTEPTTGMSDRLPLNPTVEEFAQDNLMLQGFAVGGQVSSISTPNIQQIAPSDTVPAMLTPGEFVVNARDTQKNLQLLQHINSGSTVTSENLPNITDAPAPVIKPHAILNQAPTKVDAAPNSVVQRQNDFLPAALEPLIPASSGLENQPGTTLSSLPSHSLSTNTSGRSQQPSQAPNLPEYSSPPRIFRKNNPTIAKATPSEWSSVEDLLHESTPDIDEFAPLNFGGKASQSHLGVSTSASTIVSTSSLPSPVGFAAGGEVTTPTNTIVPAQPVTEAIARPSDPLESNDDDDSNLEALAREIYSRLRQKLEIERERHGLYSGRLPW